MAKSFTLGEIAFIENFTSIPMNQVESAPQGNLMIAMVTVIKKREDKTFTVEDAMNLTSDEASEIIGPFIGTDETPAGE